MRGFGYHCDSEAARVALVAEGCWVSGRVTEGLFGSGSVWWLDAASFGRDGRWVW